ncbi:hypothetical protein RvY_09091 [Ramazzottius varieornatus]|uniref:Uncharacterized protein n=1 Tax=Ramazzottius varieornatus TaxID=947166 RepID=A0A1D1VAM3_RAMVA|nr:hypothetical protein RvY_09091 [Ramazzottius varieornatus]
MANGGRGQRPAHRLTGKTSLLGIKAPDNVDISPLYFFPQAGPASPLLDSKKFPLGLIISLLMASLLSQRLLHCKRRPENHGQHHSAVLITIAAMTSAKFPALVGTADGSTAAVVHTFKVCCNSSNNGHLETREVRETQVNVRRTTSYITIRKCQTRTLQKSA